tara:strand:+ start:763 stop:996 length:234 start_codon:yes stop_codon:yes gene_type:complete
MNNIINNWSYDKPTEPGDYLVCGGDVEAAASVEYMRFRIVSGALVDKDSVSVREYHNSYKFARLVYSPSEIKEIEDA